MSVAFFDPPDVRRVTGDAHYDTLQHLAAARSPLLQQLKLSQYMRRSRQALCSLESASCVGSHGYLSSPW